MNEQSRWGSTACVHSARSLLETHEPPMSFRLWAWKAQSIRGVWVSGKAWGRWPTTSTKPQPKFSNHSKSAHSPIRCGMGQHALMLTNMVDPVIASVATAGRYLSDATEVLERALFAKKIRLKIDALRSDSGSWDSYVAEFESVTSDGCFGWFNK